MLTYQGGAMMSGGQESRRARLDVQIWAEQESASGMWLKALERCERMAGREARRILERTEPDRDRGWEARFRALTPAWEHRASMALAESLASAIEELGRLAGGGD